MDAPEVGRVDRTVEHIYQRGVLDNLARQNPPEPARMAVYENPSSCPEIEEVEAGDAAELVGVLATRTYQVSQERGGRIPFAAIKEIIENLVHAQFKEVVVSVFQGGNSIKVSDRGPGIKDKTKALEPGYTSATTNIKGLIKGVGSGFSVARGAMTEAGGTLRLEDNLDGGTVVTLTASAELIEPKPSPAADEPAPPRLSKRQKKVVFIILEIGEVGPARLATELSVGLSTAYRDLQALEALGLIKCDKRGKRCLTETGVDSLDAIMNSA